MVIEVGLVFWQAHSAGAGCHEISQKAEPRSVAGLGVVDGFAPSVALVASVAGSLAHSSRFLTSITGATFALAVLMRAFRRASSSTPSLRSFKLF